MLLIYCEGEELQRINYRVESRRTFCISIRDGGRHAKRSELDRRFNARCVRRGGLAYDQKCYIFCNYSGINSSGNKSLTIG